jgi:exosortase/archaeosortase family protein
MISLMLGELDRLSIVRRFALVIAGALIAVLLNVIRAATLSALAATRGLGAVDQWHDMAGLLEWAGVLAGIMLTSRLLRVKTTRPRQFEGEAIRAWPAGLRPVSAGISAVALLTLLSAAGATAAWFGFHESGASVSPRWTIRKPA